MPSPSVGIAAPQSTNEASRRILWCLQDAAGNLRPGAPGGPSPVKRIGPSFRHAATGPTPVVAYLLFPADPNCLGGVLQNLDLSNTIWFGSNPNVTDATGITLVAGANIPIQGGSNIYIYCLAGSPLVEFGPVYLS